jgi:hypothetical protein
MTRLQQKSKAAKLRAMAKKKTVPTPALSDYLSQIGRKGGKARLKKMTAKERSEIARKAGLAGGRGRKKTK